MKNEFTSSEVYDCPVVTSGGTSYCYCLFPDLDNNCKLDGPEILKYYEYDGISIWKWCLCLIGIAFILRIIFWALLAFMPGNKGKRQQ
jgi:hypothetical protein